MHSLRAKLAVVWILSVMASIALAIVMSQLYAQSSSSHLARAEDQVAQACDQIRDAWRYYDNGWNGPPPNAGDPGFRADLRAVLARGLDEDDPIVGGIWQSQQGLLASQPVNASALPSARLWQPVASLAIDQDHDAVRQGTDHGDTVVTAACLLDGPVHGLVAWTARRFYAANGLSQLRLGFGVLLGLVLAITGWLTWLVATWSRHVRRIEGVLAGYAATGTGSLPHLPLTGEQELDRIVSALNVASARLEAMQCEAATLAVRVADGERLAALGRVAAGVAHEIRNPIGSMRLRAENALAGDDMRRRKALSSILRQISRLDRLLGELLAMTQRHAPEPVEIRLDQFLDAVLRDYEEAAEAAQLTLRLEADGACVRLDPEMIGRVVANLLQNAIRETPAGGRIAVTGSRDVAAGYVTISVADTGPGVLPTLRGRLFEPFVTGHAEGTGLGLAIARELVGTHGGTLELEDAEPEGGARFTIRLRSDLVGGDPPLVDAVGTRNCEEDGTCR